MGGAGKAFSGFSFPFPLSPAQSISLLFLVRPCSSASTSIPSKISRKASTGAPSTEKSFLPPIHALAPNPPNPTGNVCAASSKTPLTTQSTTVISLSCAPSRVRCEREGTVSHPSSLCSSWSSILGAYTTSPRADAGKMYDIGFVRSPDAGTGVGVT